MLWSWGQQVMERPMMPMLYRKPLTCAVSEGGGVVIMEGGHTYLSGSIVLKSHVELVVETGAVLKASEDLNDYQYISELAKRGHDIW